ncbi:MAG: hypothetical protein ACOC32_04480 [Nanoarchaeota archaeon]
MEETSEEPPPSLDEILHRVKPLYRFDMSPENKEGTLHYVRNGDPEHRFSWNPESKGLAEGIEPFTEIEFTTTSEEGRYAPNLYEIVRSVPPELRTSTAAVEVVFELGRISREGDGYRGVARLYRHK